MHSVEPTEFDSSGGAEPARLAGFWSFVRPLRFARHGACEQKNGAAKHQRIRHIIKAVGEAGAFHYSDRHLDGQLHKKHCHAQPRRCGAGFLSGKQQDTRHRVNHGGHVRPNGVSVDPGGSHPV